MGLECDCGCEVFPDAEVYWESDTAVCHACGRECSIVVDDSETTGEFDGEPIGRASVSCSEDAVDVGQPNCDGSCKGASAKWITEGHRCFFDCHRVTDEMKQSVRE